MKARLIANLATLILPAHPLRTSANDQPVHDAGFATPECDMTFAA